MANGTWKIARGRSGAHLPLAIVAVLAIVLILLGKAQTAVFDRARTNVTDWMAPALQLVREPFAAAQHWIDGLDGFFSVYQDNLKLKEQNARLQQWRNAALVLQARMHRYQALLKAVPDPSLNYRLAHVIGRASQPFLETMILDAGKADGVKPGQAVVDPRGMVGRIFLAGDHTSWVILLTDLNSRVPVMIEPEHAHAIMAGDNEMAPVIETLSQGVQLKAGDQVVTSGDGGLLPAGLHVGTIAASGKGFRVALLADPTDAEDVDIIDFQTGAAEQSPTVVPNDLPVSAAGLPPEKPQPAIAPPSAPPAPAPVTTWPVNNSAGARTPALVRPAVAAATHPAPVAAKPAPPPAPQSQDNGDDNEDH